MEVTITYLQGLCIYGEMEIMTVGDDDKCGKMLPKWTINTT